jgi:hypothetical protein
MHVRNAFALLAVLSLAGSAQAAIKFYDSSPENGIQGDDFLNSTTLCPPHVTTFGQGSGYTELRDDGLGTVTMQQFVGNGRTVADLTNGELIPIFGPGAFIFIDTQQTTFIAAPHVSNTTGIGSHGPSGTAPGQTTEWGVVSGWTVTGYAFCISSPTSICTNAEFAHGVTVDRAIESPTYDLGTWTFDAEGDYESVFGYITRTSSGGLTNNGTRPRGAFHGSSLPALPLVGFGALAVGLAVIGTRALRARK